MLDPDDLLRVTASRWFVPLLAVASREQGVRFAALVNRLGIARSMLSRSLAQLETDGWLRRNPGHGHPLRPEYILTEEGRPIGAWCDAVIAARDALGLEPDQLSRWALPLVARLDGDARRFSELAADLAGISPRALSLALKQAIALDLVERRLESSFPPTPRYSLGAKGRRLAAAMR